MCFSITIASGVESEKGKEIVKGKGVAVDQ